MSDKDERLVDDMDTTSYTATLASGVSKLPQDQTLPETHVHYAPSEDFDALQKEVDEMSDRVSKLNLNYPSGSSKPTRSQTPPNRPSVIAGVHPRSASATLGKRSSAFVPLDPKRDAIFIEDEDGEDHKHTDESSGSNDQQVAIIAAEQAKCDAIRSRSSVDLLNELRNAEASITPVDPTTVVALENMKETAQPKLNLNDLNDKLAQTMYRAKFTLQQGSYEAVARRMAQRAQNFNSRAGFEALKDMRRVEEREKELLISYLEACAPADKELISLYKQKARWDSQYCFEAGIRNVKKRRITDKTNLR